MKALVLLLFFAPLTLVACGESDPPPTSREEALKRNPKTSREDSPPKAPPPSESETVDPNSGQVIPGFSGGHLLNRKRGHPLNKTVLDAYEAHIRNPNNIELLLALASACEDNRQFDIAIAAYKKVIELDPDNVDAYNALGLLLTEYGDPNEAIAAYRKALELEPSAPINKSLGVILYEEGKYDEATAACCMALQLGDTDPELYSYIASSLYRQEKYAEAEVELRNALALYPSHFFDNMGEQLTMVLFEQEKLNEAAALCREAMARHPDKLDYRQYLISILQKQGKVAEAEAVREQLKHLKQLRRK